MGVVEGFPCGSNEVRADLAGVKRRDVAELPAIASVTGASCGWQAMKRRSLGAVAQ